MLGRPRPLLVEAASLELECLNPTIWRAVNYVASFLRSKFEMGAAVHGSLFKLAGCHQPWTMELENK